MSGITNSPNGWRNFTGSGNPNGVVAGRISDQYFDTTNFILYQCSVSGTSSTSTWIAITGGTPTAAGTSVQYVAAATTSALAGTYVNNGGVGDTFTLSATGTLAIDGITVTAQAIPYFFRSQASSAQNGLWTCTVTPATGVAGVFVRYTGYNTPALLQSTAMISPIAGNTARGIPFYLNLSNVTLPIVIGTTALNYDMLYQYAGITGGSTLNSIPSYGTFGQLAPATALPTVGRPFSSISSNTSITSTSFINQTLYLTASGLTITIPSSMTAGFYLEIYGAGFTFTIAQSATVKIITPNGATTAGTGGSIVATDTGCWIRLFWVTSAIACAAVSGNFTVT